MHRGQTSLDCVIDDGPRMTPASPARKAGGEASLIDKFAAKAAAWDRQPEILNTRHEIFEGDARIMAGVDPV